MQQPLDRESARADDAVKMSATAITAGLDDEGFAKAIENLILGK